MFGRRREISEALNPKIDSYVVYKKLEDIINTGGKVLLDMVVADIRPPLRWGSTVESLLR
jgi:hypothetical protein